MKALSELERTGLVYSQRTSGRYITEDAAMIGKLKEQLAEGIISDFFLNMEKLGFQMEVEFSLLAKSIEIKGGQEDDTGM